VKKSFEENLARLEEIAGELEHGDLPLDAALKKFDEGIRLAEFCSRKLDEAQQRVDLLLKKDGTLVATPLAGPDDGLADEPDSH